MNVICDEKTTTITCIVHFCTVHCSLEFFQVLTALFHNKSDQRPDICSVAQPTAAQHWQLWETALFGNYSHFGHNLVQPSTNFKPTDLCKAKLHENKYILDLFIYVHITKKSEITFLDFGLKLISIIWKLHKKFTFNSKFHFQKTASKIGQVKEINGHLRKKVKRFYFDVNPAIIDSKISGF